jgi:HEAT repeat protein
MTRGPDRLAVIPVAGLRGSAPVQEELEKILFERDVGAASAAAVALGSRGNATAVAPLTKALHSGEARLATAAHPDPAVRRRAQAEARLLED